MDIVVMVGGCCCFFSCAKLLELIFTFLRQHAYLHADTLKDQPKDSTVLVLPSTFAKGRWQFPIDQRSKMDHSS